ncbi:ACT domain-containing protein [Streptomyces sp. MN03-5084-2B]|nr:ACT domain-containing protein [Streptomyces sp. MN03-5084-2B]
MPDRLFVTVEHTPDVLARVVQLCRGRGYPIEELTFGGTGPVAHLAVVVGAGPRPADRLALQLDRLAGVLEVVVEPVAELAAV